MKVFKAPVKERQIKVKLKISMTKLVANQKYVKVDNLRLLRNVFIKKFVTSLRSSDVKKNY